VLFRSGGRGEKEKKTIKIQCARPEAEGVGIIDNYNGRSRMIIMEIAS
jgi:hypothetical protein